MLTRRAVLTGTAGASIAAIASAHGVAFAADSGGWGSGFGNLEGGAMGAFQKRSDGFGVFMKWEDAGAEVFYKEITDKTVGVFLKVFDKQNGWSPVSTIFLKRTTSLAGADALFQKVHADGSVFFLKIENGIGVSSEFTPTAEGVTFDVVEQSND
jgi:hypothetical protein